MDDKNLNELDGNSVLDEVILEKIEAQRKSYKTAIRNAVVRNDHAQESATKQQKRADKTKERLYSLVNGGLEGYLASKSLVVDDDEEEEGTLATPKKRFGSYRNRE